MDADLVARCELLLSTAGDETLGLHEQVLLQSTESLARSRPSALPAVLRLLVPRVQRLGSAATLKILPTLEGCASGPDSARLAASDLLDALCRSVVDARTSSPKLITAVVSAAVRLPSSHVANSGSRSGVGLLLDHVAKRVRARPPEFAPYVAELLQAANSVGHVTPRIRAALEECQVPDPEREAGST